MTLQTNWKNLPNNHLDYAGFVYEITNLLNGRKYIGKKYFWHTRRVKVKGRKNRKWLKKESDWRTYKSSCKELIRDINEHGDSNFEFKVIVLGKKRSDVDYWEASLQFHNDVLNRKLSNGEYQYYNSNILRKFWRRGND